MLFYFGHFIEILIFPPGNILLLILIACLIWRYKPTISKFLIGFSFLTLWLLSTPLVAQFLINGLQYRYPVLSSNKLVKDNEAAIVVLEAGLNLMTPEYETITVSEQTLVRLRYAAFLHQKIQAPILVSGNDPKHPSINQADYMANALETFFQIPTRWKENRGYNTALEGIYTTEILKKSAVKKIYLVTHALHMPRSIYAFQNKNLEIIPAPTGFISLDYNLKTALLPKLSALARSVSALHEYLGMMWYVIYYH